MINVAVLMISHGLTINKSNLPARLAFVYLRIATKTTNANLRKARSGPFSVGE